MRMIGACMNEMHNVSLFFLIFAALLLLYGAILAKTGSKDLLPMRAAISISSKDEVRRVGAIVCRIGVIIAVVCLIALVLSPA